MIKRLAGCIREYKLPSLITPLLVIIETCFEVLIPFYMADLIDSGINAGNMDVITSTGLKLFCFAIVSLICGSAGGAMASYASSGFAKNLSHDLYEKIQSFSFANIDKFSTAGLITRITTDVTNVQMAYQMIIRGLIRSPSMLIMTMVAAFKVNARLALIFVAIIPFLAIGIGIIFKNAFPYFEKVFKIYDKLNSVVQENLRGIRVVKSFVREDYETEKFKTVSKDMYETNLKAEYIMACMMPLMQFSTYACILGISWLGSKLIITGSMTSGQLMSMISYVGQILISLMMLTMVFMLSEIAGAAAKRIVEVLNEEPDIKNPEENAVTEVANADIEFKGVSFGYPECADCLSDINFTIKQGETVGIMGPTGSGKTSVVQLIPRLYDVRQGSVTLGGIDVRQYDITTLRKAVSMVLQKNVLFSGTIRENLLWGDENATDEEIRLACEITQAQSFIDVFDEKLDYMLEQGGSNVSGGQRQRLCIARALIAKPRILILDDSTSAVDTATEKKIREGLRKFLPDTTKIIIAQRISSIQDADKIIVLDDGKIDDIGTHDELVERCEIYREVYLAQTKDGDFDE
jgi:ATP-binding cassette subfamily B protein